MTNIFDQQIQKSQPLAFSSQQSLELGTKNPTKLNDLAKHGFKVTNREAVVAQNLGEAAQRNLDSKTKYYSGK